MNRIALFLILVGILEAGAQKTPASHVADSLFQTGNYSKAIKEYKKASEDDYAEAIAKSYEAIGNNKAALEYYERSFSNNSNNQRSLSNYGKLLLASGNPKKADSVFEHLTAKYPNNPNYYYQRGLVAETFGDSLAMPYYFKATVYDREHQNAIYKMARYHTVKRNFQAAISFTERGLSANPNSIRFLNLDALIKYHVKNYHAALKTYERLLELNQSNIQLHENLADCYLQTLQHEKGIEQLFILINEFDDKNPGYHQSLGRAFYAIKETDKAIFHTERSIALKQVSLEREYVLLASIYKKKGDYTLVFENLKLALAENPSSEMLNYQYAVAADNYFEDTATVIKYYEKYLSGFGEKGAFRDLAKQRLKDLKAELHFKKD